MHDNVVVGFLVKTDLALVCGLSLECDGHVRRLRHEVQIVCPLLSCEGNPPCSNEITVSSGTLKYIHTTHCQIFA